MLQNSQFLKDFTSIKKLGEGSFGEVYRARRIDIGLEYAIKVIRLPTTAEEVNACEREVSYLARLEHQNIVRYHTHWKEGDSSWLTENTVLDDDPSNSADMSQTESRSSPRTSTTLTSSSAVLDHPYLFIQMELCHKTLKQYILELNDACNERSRIRNDLAGIFIQITVAIKFIHSHNIIHRDLNPANIFITNRNQVKIGDFGLACPIDISQKNRSAYGTSYYIAPEIREGGSTYGPKVDVFSTGIILFELIYLCKTQFERADVLEDLSSSQIFPNEFSKLFPEEKAQIEKMLEPEPSLRQTSKQVHKWAKAQRKRFNPKCNS